MKLFLLSLFFVTTSAYKILGISPLGSRSHYAIGESIMKALHEAGHEVTMISVFEVKKPLKNFTQIKITDYMETMIKEQNFDVFEYAKLNPLMEVNFIFSMGYETVAHVMESEGVQRLLNSNEKFDAVIVELFAMDALLGLGQHFNCPVIGYNTFDGVYWNDIFTGNESPYSYVPMTFLGVPDKMNFSQRLSNTIYSLAEKLMYNFWHLRHQRKLYEKYFPSALKSFDEVMKSLSIVFMNNHVSSTSARPLMPNMIGINGIHVHPVQPLPADIQNFLDSATDGAILFSMGSHIQSKDWSTQQREAFVKTFAKLKQKVIWKYENETLPDRPGNVMIGSWIPQRDIVAHPNVKVFITHGGNLGTTEALSEGVPLLGIPLYGDQVMNLKRAVNKGYALALNLQNITEENFSAALNELLTNPKFTENAKRRSKIYNERVMSPKESVVYWTEHTIRLDGAHHLKAAGQDLNFIEFHLIDVYATLLAAAFGFLFVVCKISKLIFKKSPSKKQKKQ